MAGEDFSNNSPRWSRRGICAFPISDEGPAEIFQDGAGGEVLGYGEKNVFQITLAVQGDVHINMLSILEDEEFFIKDGFPGPCDDDDLFTAIMAYDAGIFA